MFTEVEGIDDTQGPICGSQLRKKHNTAVLNQARMCLFRTHLQQDKNTKQNNELKETKAVI